MRLKKRNKLDSKICALTAYDYPTARILDELNVDMILVGDSLGMMVFGHEDTTNVSIEMMIHHTKACRNGVKNTPLITDMPYKSYETIDSALNNANRLMEAGADGVKLEGGKQIITQIETLLSNDIPVIGHLGFLPQAIKEEKGYKKKGKTESEKNEIFNDSILLEGVGISALVLGSGLNCDGEIRVIDDIIGSYPWFTPPFVSPFCSVSDNIREAVKTFQKVINEDSN